MNMTAAFGIALVAISVFVLQASLLHTEQDDEDVCTGLDGLTPPLKMDAAIDYHQNGGGASLDVLLLIEASKYSIPYLAATLDGNFNDASNGFLARLKARLSDVRIAVSGFTNKPMPLAGPGPYGGWNQFAPSYCYRNFTPFTRDMMAVSEAFGHLMGNPVMIGQPLKATNTLRGNMFEGILRALQDPILDWRRPSAFNINGNTSFMMNSASLGTLINESDHHKTESTVRCPTSPSCEGHAEASRSATSHKATPRKLIFMDEKVSEGGLKADHHLKANLDPSNNHQNTYAEERADRRSGGTYEQSLFNNRLLVQGPMGIELSEISASPAVEDQGLATLTTGHMNMIIVLFNVPSHVEDPVDELASQSVIKVPWSYIDYDAGESILKTKGGYPSCSWRHADPEIAHGMFDGDYRYYNNTASLGLFSDFIKTMKHLNICFEVVEHDENNGTARCDEYYRDCMAFVDGIFNLTTPPFIDQCQAGYPSYRELISALNEDDRQIHLGALIGLGQNNPFTYYDDCSAIGINAYFKLGACYPQWTATYLPNATRLIIPEGTADLTEWFIKLVTETANPSIRPLEEVPK